MYVLVRYIVFIFPCADDDDDRSLFYTKLSLQFWRFLLFARTKEQNQIGVSNFNFEVLAFFSKNPKLRHP
jgi:hypothetical protein